LVALAASFAAGRFSTPTKVETKVEYVDRVREVRTTVIARVVDTKVRRVIVTAPDGSSRTEEAIDTHVDERSNESSEIAKSTESKTATQTVRDAPRVTISALVGITIPNSTSSLTQATLTYGVHAQYRIAGPFVLGAWFSTPGSIGLSGGLTF
jgi:hypothetical protein